MFDGLIDETKLTEGLAQALGAAVINARVNLQELLDGYTVNVKITFEKKGTDS